MLRSSSGLAVQFLPFDDRNAAPQADEVITLAAGQQVQRLMATVGNVYVTDADNATIPGATVLVTPQALDANGSIVGQVKRFDTKAPLAGASIYPYRGNSIQHDHGCVRRVLARCRQE